MIIFKFLGYNIKRYALVYVIHGGVQVSTGALKPQKRAAVSQSALKGELKYKR